jgi:hypothetical protein
MDPSALMALARHSEEVATVRVFRERSGANQVALLLETAQGATALVECDATGAIEITEGDDVAFIPANAAIPGPARPLPDIRPTPASAIRLDEVTGELAAPLGTIEHLAGIVLALASSFGGLTVATAEFATSDPQLPITFAAREGERVVLAAGDAQYEL